MRVLEKSPRTSEVGFQNHGNHAAKSAHLAFRQLMMWMRFQTRIADRSELRICFEHARDLECVFAMSLHPQGERFQSAQRKEAVERSSNRANGILQESHLVAD